MLPLTLIPSDLFIIVKENVSNYLEWQLMNTSKEIQQQRWSLWNQEWCNNSQIVDAKGTDRKLSCFINPVVPKSFYKKKGLID